jgi:hypothetical protein
MVRLYGHGPRGVRLVDHVPFGNRKHCCPVDGGYDFSITLPDKGF